MALEAVRQNGKALLQLGELERGDLEIATAGGTPPTRVCVFVVGGNGRTIH